MSGAACALWVEDPSSIPTPQKRKKKKFAVTCCGSLGSSCSYQGEVEADYGGLISPSPCIWAGLSWGEGAQECCFSINQEGWKPFQLSLPCPWTVCFDGLWCGEAQKAPAPGHTSQPPTEAEPWANITSMSLSCMWPESMMGTS